MSQVSSGDDAKHSKEVSGTEPSDLYCVRLLALYNIMRTKEGNKGDLLSHVPEWARSLAEGGPSRTEVDAPEFSQETLRRKPRLQAALANCTSYTPSKWILEQELSARRSNETQRGGEPRPSWDASSGMDVYDAATKENLKGLALSGGGIRSATFSLGILQSLAAEGLLGKFDYLSSVSGGGYIHQWLAAWIRREPKGMTAVITKMLPLPERGSMARSPEQINWLRRYSSYLTPRRGPFTADTWTMIAIWFRNTGLNQIVLFSFLFVCLELARALTLPFQIFPATVRTEAVIAVVGSMAAVWCFVGAAFFGHSLASQTRPPGRGGSPPNGAIGNGKVLSWIVAPGFLLSILLALITGTAHDGGHAMTEYLIALWGVYILALLMLQTFMGRAPETSYENDPSRSLNFFRGWFAFSAMLCTLIPVGAVGFICSHGTHLHAVRALADSINRHLPQVAPCPKGFVLPTAVLCCTQQKPACTAIAAPNAEHPVTTQMLVAVFLPLIFFGVQWLCVRLQLGILGRGYEDSRREWLARLGAWAAIVSVLWVVLGVIARVGPSIFYALFDRGFTRALYSVGVTIATHAAVLYAGGSSKTSGAPDPRRMLGYSPLDLVGLAGAPIAILFLLIIASGCLDALLYHAGTWGNSLLVFFFSLIVLLVFGCRVDINEFSMHPFYRNRLARCYLGASNGRRVPDPFTGFDDHEEASGSTGMTLAELLPERFGGMICKGRPYDGPMPIFCSTVNITSGADLAYQDRKGASFAFTPMYSGYHVNWTVERKDGETTYNGFVPTREYAYRPQICEIRKDQETPGPCCGRRTGILLASVAAISGAALSPNQGYNSQPSLAFLMTLFNVRLGWWIANTRKPEIWPNQQFRPSPRLGLLQMIKELCGSTDDTTNYLCLSDGGQFDNMGLYELVRRRASVIVVCDGEEDQRSTFEGMGLAVAKARIDFGVDIRFDQDSIDRLAPDKTTGRSKVHMVVGTIQYPSPPSSKKTHRNYRGTIVYLKTAFVGDEPLDLLHYKREHPDFPQEGTLNQWFTEAQFESYRSLGQLTGQKAAVTLRRLMADKASI